MVQKVKDPVEGKEDFDLKSSLRLVNQFKRGEVSPRAPEGRTGVQGKIADKHRDAHGHRC